MTLVFSWILFILVQSVTYNAAQLCDTKDRFNNTWFGSDCQYKCHCKNNVACNVTNGDCPNACDIGWFGPACQYADLANTAKLILSDGASKDITNITDGDDTTCTDLTVSSFWLRITWNFNIYFTWLRLVVSIAESQSERFSIKFPDNVPTQNSECINVFIDKITMDIYCNISKPLNEIFLNGSAVSTICSLYISKGRNVALKQPTNQTSNFYDSYYLSSAAVDGNGYSIFSDGSCTHTAEGDPAPTWILYFKSVVTVTSYTIYNRVQPLLSYNREADLFRLKGFILRTFDQTNNIVQNYTDTETSVLEVYNILSTDPWAQVSKVQMTATDTTNLLILTLCEVEIFGDSVCQIDKFKYGHDCENVCNCAVPGEKCFVSTGNCPSGCKAGFYGQGCNKSMNF
ncbi:unnamed protein product [Lymnaea stagnalis]|uniref:Fucolectin tachylectin-4 pentraxin-1 domain-containing protein n=1 Tax=Lymnaea stagnalis TaxID=6523 RepID=A0AAV2HJI4_LYMST